MNEKQEKRVPGWTLAFVKIGNAVEKCLYVLGGTAVTVFLGAVFLDVLAREITKPIVWMQEIALLGYVWAIFLGAAIGIRRGTHFTIDILIAGFKGVARKVIELFDEVVTTGFIIAFAYYSAKYLSLSVHRMSQPSGICLGFFTASMTVGSLCMLLFCIERFILFFLGTDLNGVQNSLKEGRS